MDLKLDEGLKALIESGKGKGFLTYTQVNEYLPDDAVNPEKLDKNDGLGWSAGASLTYHFGRAALAPKTSSEPAVKRGAWHISIPDTDHDGVPDDEDQCKNTPTGAHPDPFRPDGDGVSDADDACPTKAGSPSTDASKNGCPDGHKKVAPAAPPPPSAQDEEMAPKPVKKRHHPKPAVDTGGERIK